MQPIVDGEQIFEPERFVQCIAGTHHSIGLTEDLDVYTWGYFGRGNLGRE